MTYESAIVILWREVSRPMLHLFDMTRNLDAGTGWNMLKTLQFGASQQAKRSAINISV